MLPPATKLEKEVFEFYKQVAPLSCFALGLKECAGRLFVPNKKNHEQALQTVSSFKIKALRDPELVRYLSSIELSLEFEEPPHGPGSVFDAFYIHVVIEGFNEKHLSSLCNYSVDFLQEYAHLAKKKWPVELKIMTVNKCGAAIAFLSTVKKNVK